MPLSKLVSSYFFITVCSINPIQYNLVDESNIVKKHPQIKDPHVCEIWQLWLRCVHPQDSTVVKTMWYSKREREVGQMTPYWCCHQNHRMLWVADSRCFFNLARSLHLEEMMFIEWWRGKTKPMVINAVDNIPLQKFSRTAGRRGKPQSRTPPRAIAEDKLIETIYLPTGVPLN